METNRAVVRRGAKRRLSIETRQLQALSPARAHRARNHSLRHWPPAAWAMSLTAGVLDYDKDSDDIW
jgi:hypothetical protein